ncbi:hypothetical protein [Methylobacterium sp. V23]|uniref:hypothetical protein n=1 Tax=Methylobacterium sp. V23 TaxID=2044878 RepID=UPI000CDB8746|nr:hypothetical protein [Methylobacterium sp. V23]POR42498.1 hypothetical protein CRT23_13695 [Methylobacterium sp. V23]
MGVWNPSLWAALLMAGGNALPAAAGSTPGSDLVGRWVSEGLVLTIDQDAVQANRDPSKPFQWDALHVLDRTEKMIVFDIGKERFIGLLDGDHLTLTQSGVPGSHDLRRQARDR